VTATPMHGSTSRLYVDAYDLTPFTQNASAQTDVEVTDTTAWGATANSNILRPAKKGEISADGMWVANATGITGGTVHTALSAAQGSGGRFAALCMPDTLGSIAAGGYGILDQYKVTTAVDKVLDYGMHLVDQDGLDWCEVLHPVLNTVETGAGNSSGVDDGASAPLTTGGVIYLMVLGVTGTSITVKLQSATTIGGAYADVAGGAFTAVSAPGAGNASCQRVVIPAGTTINRCVRAAWTGTFNPATFLMLFHRNQS